MAKVSLGVKKAVFRNKPKARPGQVRKKAPKAQKKQTFFTEGRARFGE